MIRCFTAARIILIIAVCYVYGGKFPVNFYHYSAVNPSTPNITHAASLQ